MKSRVVGEPSVRDSSACSLLDKDGDAMLANAVEQLRRRLVAEVRQVRPVERRISRQVLREVEAERYLALKPRLHRVPVGGDHLRR